MKVKYLEYGNPALDANTSTPSMPHTAQGSVSVTAVTDYKLYNLARSVWMGAIMFRADNLEYYCTFTAAATTINGTVKVLMEHEFEGAGQITCVLSVKSDGFLYVRFSNLPKNVTMYWKLVKWL